MPSQRQYYKDARGGRHWRTVYIARQGPLKGRTYKSYDNYKRRLEQYKEDQEALAKAKRRKPLIPRQPRDRIESEERYNQLLQAFILQKGAGYAKRHLARFKELYRKAKAKNWEPCPPVTKSTTEDDAPYAFLLDFIGVRPIDEFGWRCIGDTP